jgi:hypothetical protein
MDIWPDVRSSWEMKITLTMGWDKSQIFCGVWGQAGLAGAAIVVAQIGKIAFARAAGYRTTGWRVTALTRRGAFTRDRAVVLFVDHDRRPLIDRRDEYRQSARS